MSQDPGNITFQVTVIHLTHSFQLPEQDIHVTVSIGDISKITCSGDISENGLMVTWNHPFLFTAPSSASIQIAICTLPKKLTLTWNKELLGDQMTTNVGDLLDSESEWQTNVPGISTGHSTLSLLCKACDVLIIPDGHDCLSALKADHRWLYKYGTKFKNIPCLSTLIEVELTRLDLCPFGHTNHTTILNFLTSSFLSRYNQSGNISDLNKAIEVAQARLDLCPLDHSEHNQALGWVAGTLRKLYCIQRNREDLNRLIDVQQRWLDSCPLNNPGHAPALGDLAISLKERYLEEGNITDLNQAIEMAERRLKLCPLGDLQHGKALANLAVSLRVRYHGQSDIADLNRAIDLGEKHLELCSPGDQSYETALHNLARSLSTRFDVEKNHHDLIRAINLLKEALPTYPVHHPFFASIACQLAETILHAPNSSQSFSLLNQPLPLPDEAFETYRLLKGCGLAVSLNLLNATQAWVKNAEKHEHPSVLEAYQTSLQTLDHFISFNPSLDSRHETMQMRMADLANDAFSCATRHGDFQKAVELLEQGRGILWNQLARCDISVTTLENQGYQGCELKRKFTRLSEDLRKHAERSGDKGMDPYWRVQEEWQLVVDKIRCLDGFSRFLLPPHFEDLQRTAQEGPIIVVNASKHSCDALIVLYAGPPTHISLPCSFTDVTQLCIQLSELTRDQHAYGDHREYWVKEMLRELWSFVVEPIFTVLENDIQLPPGSRIWWCPTSKFTLLPFHAAGPHRNGEKNLMDIYVSSYAPSLSALVRARDRIRSQKNARDASGGADVVSFAAVGQGRPIRSQLCELPEVGHEIDKIRNETNMPPNVEFETITDAAATVEGAIQAFRDHRWVHVACHGAQHAEKPFESSFAMRDGKLTLMRIIQERYTNSEFAFLSACHTAVGDESTPDEVLHLAAGMQFAGFNGVIGTLWRVDDAVAHQLVTRFYKEMFNRLVIGFEHAAAALNTAVVETADELSLEKRMVFVHIGI